MFFCACARKPKVVEECPSATVEQRSKFTTPKKSRFVRGDNNGEIIGIDNSGMLIHSKTETCSSRRWFTPFHITNTLPFLRALGFARACEQKLRLGMFICDF